MERDRLAQRLEAGRSMESIARELGCHPSTVAYWVNRHSLVSHHAHRHARKGGIPRERILELVEQGLSVRQIAAECEVSATTVRHWLRRYGLKTAPSHYVAAAAAKSSAIVRECRTHGWTTFRLEGSRAHYRCAACVSERVADRRRALKQALVAEAGGRCVVCGFDRYAGALQFHHVDPNTKAFDIAGRGLTRSLARLRVEAGKCVLLCANCHAEVEAGLTRLPFASAPRTPG